MKSLHLALHWVAGFVIGVAALAGGEREAAADLLWSTLPPLPEARAYAGVGPVGAGGVLVVGGAAASGDPLTSAVVFNAATSQWSVQAVDAGPRIWPTVVPWPDGRALVVGGFTLDGSAPEVVFYAPDNGVYAPMGSGPARGAMAWAEAPNGTLVFVGGYDPNGFWADTDVFSKANNNWHAGSAMGAPRAFAGAVTLPDGRVMVAGGCAQSLDVPVADATTEIYDPASDTWSAGPPMATARWWFASSMLPSGRWMVAGGVTTVNGEMVATDQVEIFDPVTMVWTAGPSLGTARGGPSFATLADGSLIVAGGESGPLLTALPVASAERFDEAAGAWTSAGAMSSPRYQTAGARLSTGMFVVPGGFSDPAQDAVASVDLFQPDAVPCATVADCPPAADDCLVVTCDAAYGVCKSTPKSDGLPCDAGPEFCNAWTQCVAGKCVIQENDPCGFLDDCHGEGACGASGMCEWPVLPDETECEGGLCQNGVCELLDQPGGSGGGGSGGAGGSGGSQAVAGGHGSSCGLARDGGGAGSWIGAFGALAAIAGLSMRRRGRAKNTNSQ